MDIDRPHRSNSSNNSGSSSNTTSELFICFTSRLSSSSSMKISSKSILSPGRSRESSQVSLSNSLSRRLRSNGSMKGGQASPMFPTNSSNGKKRGCSFENPEPSSPKVTCIGQVRVKTKKQGRKMKMTGSRSQRRGEVSFRRVDQTNSSNNTSNINLEVSNGAHQDFSHTHQVNNQQECFPHRNQRWVHLPLTICEALRAFGAEFNCFLPCRSSCMASEKEKQEKAAAAGSNEGNSCGAVFARWLVAVQEDDDGKRREIELVVGEEEEREEDFSERRRSYRRHVFEEIEFTEEKYGAGNDDSVAQEEEAARVSICIPPKNALLLMRCRSDPVKMAALANKFWEAPVPNNDGENEVGDNIDVKEVKEVEEEEAEEGEKGINNDVKVGGGGEVEKIEIGQELEQTEDLEKERLFSCQTHENEVTLEEEENDDEEDSKETRTDIEGVEEANLVQQEEETGFTQKTEINVNASSSHDETEDDPEKLKIQENEDNNNENINMLQENEDNQENRNGSDDDIEESSVHVSVHQELAVLEIEENQESKSVEEEQELSMQKSKEEERDTAEKACCCIQKQNQETQEEEEERCESKTEGPKTEEEEEEEIGMESTKEVVESQQPLLPECLLLMMCEPKLSMEVSKETWVCSTDFIRWLPEPSRPHQVKKKDGGDQPKKRINNHPSVHGNLQPPRSSCSYPAKPPAHAAGAESMTTAIEKKLVGTKGYEPFVLTRCKSEPMRSASKLAPEACFWKNRKLEPHRPATLGVGAAGVGF